MEFEPITPDFGLITWQFIVYATLILWIYALVDILSNSFKKNEKLIWLLSVLFVPMIGAILYIIIGRKQKLKFN